MEKMRIRGQVRYGTDALAAVLHIAGIEEPDFVQVDQNLTYTGRHGDEVLSLQKYHDWLKVTFAGPEKFADRLERYFRDVNAFGGSNIALAASRRVHPAEISQFYQV